MPISLCFKVKNLHKMASKRNNFLDISDGEDDSLHLSGVEEDSKFSRLTGRSAKQRKLSDESSESSEGEGGDEVEREHTSRQAIVTGSTRELKTTKSANPQESLTNLKLKPLSAAQLAASQRKAKKTGVIYISRIPPFMKPSTIRHLLTPYGTILRLFLTPEPSPVYVKRVKSGGNKKRSFIDGWVEFASKKRAKICTETLNGNNIGGKKGGWYYDDIWNMKYLKGFKWDDLMEQVQSEERIREGRLRAEIQKEARERKAFLGNVEIAKRERGKEAKQKKRKLGLDGQARQDATEPLFPEGQEGEELQDRSKFERRFRQNEVHEKMNASRQKEQPEDVKRVLSKIF